MRGSIYAKLRDIRSMVTLPSVILTNYRAYVNQLNEERRSIIYKSSFMCIYNKINKKNNNFLFILYA